MSSKNLVQDFKANEILYKAFCEKIKILIEDIMESSGIKPHQISSRVKSIERLDEKIQRKKDKYEHLGEITDLVGVRIITYFEDDVDKIATIIEKEFQKDETNSIDKRILSIDRFGYKSLHYVVSLNSNRNKLQEYKRFKDLKVEIQIRSVLQHAWAEIEHDIGYKGEVEIPDFAKRRFNRIAALLELADIEFVQLKNSLEAYEGSLIDQLKNNPKAVSLDKASILSFISTSSEIERINKKTSELLNVAPMQEIGGVNVYLDRMQYFNISNIDELQKYLLKYEAYIPKYIACFLRELKRSKITDFPMGWPIFYLGYMLATIDRDEKKASEFINQLLPHEKDSKRLLFAMMAARNETGFDK